MRIFILGAGHVGTALSIVFKNYGFDVLISSRTEKSARKSAEISGAKFAYLNECKDANVIFLTVPDSEIKNAARKIEKLVSENQVVAHTSGAFSSDIISFLSAHTASLHPLKSFADPIVSANSIDDTLFTFEGDKFAEDVLKSIVRKINGRFVIIKSEHKVLYHLSAVIAANYTVTIYNLAENILETAGFEKRDAEFALTKLLEGVLENIKTKGAISALTGPIERGDAETVRKHLEAINDPLLKNIYIFLGFATLNVAEKKGLRKEKIDDIRKVLNEQNNCS